MASMDRFPKFPQCLLVGTAEVLCRRRSSSVGASYRDVIWTHRWRVWPRHAIQGDCLKHLQPCVHECATLAGRTGEPMSPGSLRLMVNVLDIVSPLVPMHQLSSFCGLLGSFPSMLFHWSEPLIACTQLHCRLANLFLVGLETSRNSIAVSSQVAVQAMSFQDLPRTNSRETTQ